MRVHHHIFISNLAGEGPLIEVPCCFAASGSNAKSDSDVFSHPLFSTSFLQDKDDTC